jgi:hypothetical protein
VTELAVATPETLQRESPFLGNDDIADAGGGVQSAGDTVYQNVVHAKVVDHELRDHSGVLYTHTSQHNEDPVAAQDASGKFVAVDLIFMNLGGLGQQQIRLPSESRNDTEPGGTFGEALSGSSRDQKEYGCQ